MKIYFGIILVLLLPLESAMYNLETELRVSIDKAMQCHRREPPPEPVIAMSPKRFSQLVGLLRHDIKPRVCDTSRHYPPFRLEDPSTWPFCVFGICRSSKCICFDGFYGPSCAEHNSKCWLMYCFLTSCHSSLQSFKCSCDEKLQGTKIKGGEFWYDEGKESVYKPPPPHWNRKANLQAGRGQENAPINKQEILVPVNKLQKMYPLSNDQPQQLPVEELRQIAIYPASPFPNDGQSNRNPQNGQNQGSFNNGQFGNPFQSQQYPNRQQNQGGSFQSQQQNGRYNNPNDPGASGNQRNPGSSKGLRKNSGVGVQDSTDDIEEALDEMTEEPSFSISLFKKQYVVLSVLLILNYGYQYILNI